MTKLFRLFVIWGIQVVAPVTCLSQYILNGNATQDSCNCYTLTQPVNEQSGSVWQSTKINLNDSFDFSFKVYLGCIPTGADGIVFILQQSDTSIGIEGEGLGFEGISPSIGISLDTYQNSDLNDPTYDHISIQADGVVKHGNDLAGPVPASPAGNNIKDCQWHDVRIKWDPSTHILSAYFDGVFRLSAQKDLVATVFGNDPMVYWGFSGSTGGFNNLQKFCTPLVSGAGTDLTANATCIENPVIFQDSSTSFSSIQNYYWDFGDSTFSNLENPPPHFYSRPGTYTVTHSVTAEDNCTSNPITKLITITSNPTLSLHIFNTCQGLSPRIAVNTSLNSNDISQWNWKVDGVDFSSLQNPDFSKLPAGNDSAELNVTSNTGCKTNNSTADFKIDPIPAITFNAANGCVNTPILFLALQTDSLPKVTDWLWNFGDNDSANQKNSQHVYSVGGNYKVQLTAEATNGCTAVYSENVLADQALASAGNDTIVLPDTFFQLRGNGGDSYLWTPATGLNDPDIPDPTGNVNQNMDYLLRVTTAEGCTDTASVKVTMFTGSAVYVPTGFTPNHDGLNDIIKPYLVGIKNLDYFTIYNRWGKRVFSTNEMNTGWDGNFNGQMSGVNSVFVWVLQAEDLIGKVYKLRGTFILLK